MAVESRLSGSIRGAEECQELQWSRWSRSESGLWMQWPIRVFGVVKRFYEIYDVIVIMEAFFLGQLLLIAICIHYEN